MRKIKIIFFVSIQFLFYFLLTPISFLLYKNKRVWIVCERGDDARDNGYWLFYSLCNKYRYVNCYYLIDKKSPDFQKVKKLGKVIKYKSFKHWLLYIFAEVRATTHLAAFAPGNYIGEYFKHHKQRGVNVFLQHGITHNEFPSNYYKNNGSDLFICGAKPEYDFLSKNCGYPISNIVYTGFNRFDELHDFETKKQILIMPSWRSYLYDLSEENFKKSSYFKNWYSLLTNNKLIDYCRKQNTKVVFYPHYEMQKFIECFEGIKNDVVELADFDHFDVQQLLKDSKLLISDYSSIFFDFAYMKKPLFLFQFDREDFYSRHYSKSYFDHSRDGFGEVIFDSNVLVEKCIKIMNDGFEMPKEYKNRVDDFFLLNDKFNCDRVYQAIVKKFIEKKKHKASEFNIKLCVAADDYGRNFESSEGIRRAFNEGFIDKTSIIMNKDERKCLDIESIKNKNVSLHVNLTEGYSSYFEDDKMTYCVDDKESIAAKEINTRCTYFKLSKEAAKVIETEVRAQCELFKNSGLKCISFDSHGHIHNKMPIAKIIVPILKEYGFSEARIPSNVFSRHLLFDLFYKKRVIRFYRKNFKTCDYFCNVDDFIHIKNYKKYEKKTIEVMVHPFIEDNKLVNRNDIYFTHIFE